MIGASQPTRSLTLITTPNHTMSVILDIPQSSLSGGQEPQLLATAEIHGTFHTIGERYSGTSLAQLMISTSAEEFTESKDMIWK